MSYEIKTEVSPATNSCPDPTLWSCYDENSSEVEVLAFLKALVVLLKPKVIVETGTYKGYGTRALSDGVEENGSGKVFTTEIDVNLALNASLKFWNPKFVFYRSERGVDLIGKLESIDLAFIDSGNTNCRLEEVAAVLPRLSPSGVVVVHDTGENHDLRPGLEAIIRRENLQAIFFDTPRGLCLLRK